MPATIHLDLEAGQRPSVHPARLHGAACALLEPTSLPHQARYKPFSVWPLLNDGNIATWRLGWLGERPPAVTASTVTFGDTSHRVLARRAQEISFARLAASAPCRRADIEVVSPLYFSRNRRDYPLPDPTLLLRSVLDRWDAHSPGTLGIPEAARRALLSTVYVATMDGRTADAPVSASLRQTGFLGSLTLALTRDADDTVASLFSAALRFAEIAGGGAQTTHGFGGLRVALLPSRPRSRRLGTDQPNEARNHRGPRTTIVARQRRSSRPSTATRDRQVGVPSPALADGAIHAGQQPTASGRVATHSPTARA